MSYFQVRMVNYNETKQKQKIKSICKNIRPYCDSKTFLYLGTFANELLILKSATQRALSQPVLNTTLFLIAFNSFGSTATHVSQNAAISKAEKKH